MAKKGSKKKLATEPATAVESPSTSEQAAGIQLAPTQEQNMTLTLKGLGKSGKMAFYTGAALTLSIPVNAFVGKTAPATITDLSVFAERVEKAAKIVETKEARKARLAALPKKTLAERVAAAEAKSQALRDKLAKQTAAPVEQPAL